MGVLIHWENSRRTAAVLRFNAPWTWEQYEQAGAELEAMVRGVSHQVDVLIDMTHAGDIPPDGLFRMGELYTADLPNVGEYVFIGAPDGFETMMDVADRYYTAMGGSLDYQIA